MSNEASMELQVLRKLHEAVRDMFKFSGWEDGVDDDAAAAVRRVSRMIDMIDDIDELIFNLPPTGEGRKVNPDRCVCWDKCLKAELPYLNCGGPRNRQPGTTTEKLDADR